MSILLIIAGFRVPILLKFLVFQAELLKVLDELLQQRFVKIAYGFSIKLK